MAAFIHALISKGVTNRSISHEVGRSAQLVSAVLTGYARNQFIYPHVKNKVKSVVLIDTQELLKKLYELGINQQQIANELNVTRCAVNHVIHKKINSQKIKNHIEKLTGIKLMTSPVPRKKRAKC